MSIRTAWNAARPSERLAALGALTLGVGALAAGLTAGTAHGATLPPLPTVEVTGTYAVADPDGTFSPWIVSSPDLHRVAVYPGGHVIVVVGECAPVDPITDTAPPDLVRDATPDAPAVCAPAVDLP